MTTSSRTLLSPGHILMTLANLSYALGAFIADYNETHIYNPRWPPHAKFHNGQTMTLGLLLASASLSLLYQSLRPGRAPETQRENLWWAAVIGSFYCAAGLAAILYPDTAWTDPEFVVEGQVAQMPIFAGVVVVMWVGYAFEVRRVGEGSKEKGT